jgi:hypothetical protein
VEFLKGTCPNSWEKLAGYKGHCRPWEKLMPAEKARLLNKKGWDLTPRAFIEYSRLNGKYKKIKNDYPPEYTLWEADAVFERLIRNLR